MHPDLARREVSLEKITRYLLNDLHPHGRSKAAFSRSFGFDGLRPDELQAALHAHPERNEVAHTAVTLYGSKLVIQCTIATPDKRDPCVATVWLVPTGEPARLVTAYPGG